MTWPWGVVLARRCACVGACTAALSAAVRPVDAQVTVAVSAPASVAPRTPVLVRVEVTAPANASVRLTSPAFAPFRLARTDRAPTDTAGLRGRQRLEWRFVLQTSGAGTYAFDPFVVDVEGTGLRSATFRSRAWSVAVLPAAAVTPQPALARSDLTATDPERLAFDARVTPERVYVGEQATLELRVGVGTRVRDRLRRSPEFSFPSVAGVVTYDLSSRHASTATGDVHVYRRALFPLAAGPVDVPAAQLMYALTPEDDPFGAEQRIEARTPVRHLVAVAPPAAGRPAGWDGAVGRFRASARVDTAHARVGDAVTYTLRVEGTGNVLLLPRPALAVPWADVSTAAERVAVDSSGDLAGGSKEFDWLLTPRAGGTVRVPPAHYAYFDPRTSGYAFADAPAVELRVAPGAAAVPPVATARTTRSDAPAASGLGVQRRWNGERGSILVDTRGFWFALAAVPMPGALWLLAAASLARWRTRRNAPGHRTGTDRAGSPRTNAAAALAEFFDGLPLLLGRSDIPVLDARSLVRALRRGGVSAALAAECAAAVDGWTRAAYGTGDVTPGTSNTNPRALLGRIAVDLAVAERGRGPITAVTINGTPRRAARRDGIMPRVLPRHLYPALAVGVATLAVAFVAPRLSSGVRARTLSPGPVRATAAFDAGVAAYTGGDPARARDLFAAAAAAAPNAPAAWLNAGTAAWSAGDTAAAALAWHRAARLAPGLPHIQSRLERLPRVAPAGHVGAAPVVDARALGILALAVAAVSAAWMTVVASASVGRAPVGRAPVGRAERPAAAARVARSWWGPSAMYLVAVATATGAALAARAMDPRGLVVLRAATTLRPDPAFTATGDAAVATGEVARVVSDEAGWMRVRLDGGRDGWVRAAQVAPLDGPP